MLFVAILHLILVSPVLSNMFKMFFLMTLIVEKHESVVSKNRIFEYIFARISHEPTLSQSMENDVAYNDFQRYFRR